MLTAMCDAESRNRLLHDTDVKPRMQLKLIQFYGQGLFVARHMPDGDAGTRQAICYE